MRKIKNNTRNCINSYPTIKCIHNEAKWLNIYFSRTNELPVFDACYMN